MTDVEEINMAKFYVKIIKDTVITRPEFEFRTPL